MNEKNQDNKGDYIWKREGEKEHQEPQKKDKTAEKYRETER
jgi:hypothetical protein